MMIDTLRGAEPVRAELERATKVIPPGQRLENRALPHDFFSVSPEEVRGGGSCERRLFLHQIDPV